MLDLRPASTTHLKSEYSIKGSSGSFLGRDVCSGIEGEGQQRGIFLITSLMQKSSPFSFHMRTFSLILCVCDLNKWVFACKFLLGYIPCRETSSLPLPTSPPQKNCLPRVLQLLTLPTAGVWVLACLPLSGLPRDDEPWERSNLSPGHSLSNQLTLCQEPILSICAMFN